ncbi:MAG: recombinase family protein [Caldilineaceae bacterium]
MSQRIYLPQDTNDSVSAPGQSILPIDKPVANYYRQSTLTQVGNVSTEIQTVDMQEYLQRLGWDASNIYMIDMDKGVSGTKKIDEREGMRLLFNLITSGQIGAVACQDEDRLFRDITQIQVNIFIEACRANNVQVITPSIVYDFAHPMHGVFHARQFRFKSEMAADYINSFIMGRLQNAKMRLIYSGLWAGSSMPAGFMVDNRKKLFDGSVNPNYRRYVEFTPYSEVAREYFRLFVSFNGCVTTTINHIAENGPYYPDPSVCLPPEGFKTVYRFKKQKNGRFYVGGRTAFDWMMTNANYIGHWVYNNTVLVWNNHEAIVDPTLFYKAFNCISPNELSGAENKNFSRVRTYTRPVAEKEREADKPLCTGLLFSELDGKLLRVGTMWKQFIKYYSYFLSEYGGTSPKRCWTRKAERIDVSVTTLLLEKLRNTFNPDAWGVAVYAKVKARQ